MSDILVSVVVPVFNNKGTVAAAIESALRQRFDGGFEVIVVNDGSTDGTRAELSKFGDRIRVIDQMNLGVSAARNAGIAAAQGKYIALLDGDDVWFENKLARMIPVLESNPECVGVFSDAIQVDGRGEVVIPFFVPPEQAHSPTLEEMLQNAWMIFPSAAVIRRETLTAIGGFSTEFGSCGYGGEDVFAFLLARELGELRFIAEKLLTYRLADFEEHFAKRPLGFKHWQENREHPESFFKGNQVFARLVGQRFGPRGRALVRQSHLTQSLGLVSLGLMSVHDGDMEFARRCYLRSLRLRPFDLKTYMRLAWAALPATITGRISSVLSPRIKRGLTGPPFHVLYDRSTSTPAMAN
jgi:glycosyltransferase involved in cell wall biosynthesis